MKMDTELLMMSRMGRQLDTLSPEARGRVLEYLAKRYPSEAPKPVAGEQVDLFGAK